MTGSGTRNLPAKRYFKIGEVCEITGLKPHILRYWENEFKQLKPAKTKSNQRLYRKKDVETIIIIKRLLYDQQFTIPGARAKLDQMKNRGLEPSPRQLKIEFDPAGREELIEKIIAELEQIKNLLDNQER